jgi:hypothetical protein
VNTLEMFLAVIALLFGVGGCLVTAAIWLDPDDTHWR